MAAITRAVAVLVMWTSVFVAELAESVTLQKIVCAEMMMIAFACAGTDCAVGPLKVITGRKRRERWW